MRTAALLLSLLVAPLAAAQEFDIFDPNDFVDPRARGAVFTREGNSIIVPGNPFRLVRAYAGTVKNYQWRLQPTEDEVKFAHIVGSAYWRNLQANVKLTLLEAERSAELPEWRVATQFAYYFADTMDVTSQEKDTEGKETKVETSEDFSGRFLASVAVERGVGKTQLELGAQLDAAVTGLQTSLVWVQRRAGDDPVYRIAYFYRAGPWKWHNTYTTLNIGIGTDRTLLPNHYEYRGVLTTTLVKADGWRPGINISYAPTYLNKENRAFHEIAVFVDSTIWSRLIRMPIPTTQ